MTRNLKALGLALVAVFAMGAIAASAAQAVGPSFTPASYPAWLTIDPLGTQTYTTNTGQIVNCTNVSGHATIKEPGVGDTTVTFTDVTYTSCTAKVGASTLPATVDMTGCDYLFHGGETSGTAGHYINGSVTIVCPVGVTGPDVKIYLNAANHASNTVLCTITVWNTVTAGSITTTNTAGTPNDVDVKSVGVTNPVTRDGSALCGSPASAVYTGEVTVTAYEDLGTSGGNPLEGNRIGLTVSD